MTTGTPTFRRAALPWAVTTLLALMASTGSHAFEIETDNPDMKVRWDNTFKYSTAARVKDRSSVLTADANLDDGDRNFSKGIISNRLDVLSEFDVTYRNMGFRISGAGWYDSVYMGNNGNNSASTVNHTSTAYNEFASGTQDIHGSKVELLDAFVFGKTSFGDVDATMRLGRHAVLYGESLFFGGNGIAGGQQPLDIVKIASVPNTQFKEFIRPVPQVSTLVQLTSNVAVGGYYQFGWERSRVPSSGSYFSFADPQDAGGELISGPGFSRTHDHEPPNGGQGGAQLRIRSDELNTDFGLYAIRFHGKEPINTVNPALGQYYADFAQGIHAFGGSASTTIDNVNLAGEISMRTNQPLARGASVIVGVGAPASQSTYAVGKTAHAQLSWIASLGPSFVSQSADLLGEVAWNRVLSITSNAEAIDPNASRDAWGARIVYSPTYTQAYPGIDLSVPMGIGYTKGRSGVFGGTWGPDGGGDVSVGLSGTYLGRWKFGLNYTHYYGKAATLTDANSYFNYGQFWKDRDYVSFTVSNTF
jgi:hypothetical protein